MSHDDSSTMAAVLSAAAATLANLQTMREGMAATFAEEPGSGGSGAAGGEADDDWELGLESEEEPLLHILTAACTLHLV